MENQTKKSVRKWTRQEEITLVNQIRVFPQNLAKCFIIVAEQIDRTPAAVSSHWYTKTSKDPDYLCFFTASSKHVSKNRKNGLGNPSTMSIWQRLLKIIKNI